MVDLETFGNTSTAVITSIAAVLFNIETGEISEDKIFFESVDPQSCINLGMTVNGSTILWWLQQSEGARKKLYQQKGKNISEVLHLFRVYLQSIGTEDLKVWGNSARFDLGILENAYTSVKQQIPWYFRNERDVRTLVSFAPKIKEEAVFIGTEHNPIDDCKFQIGYCCNIWKSMSKV